MGRLRARGAGPPHPVGGCADGDRSRSNGPVPWCTTCDRFLSPATVHADGTCPSCGGAIDPGRARAADPSTDAAARPVDDSYGAAVDDDRPPIPWHLWLLLAALAVYLGYRAFQGLEWAFGI